MTPTAVPMRRSLRRPAPGWTPPSARCGWLLARRLGLWDVYGSCEREGSLDTSIRHPQVNDFARLHQACPRLAAVAHNGGESYRHARAVLDSFSHLRSGEGCGATVGTFQTVAGCSSQ